MLTFDATGFSSVGSIRFAGGTGVYTGIRGHGQDIGSTSDRIGQGHIEAIVTGVGQ